nr:hypothetical protein [Tanacetum cinerariifolium]
MCLAVRMMSRLSLKNDMSLRDKRDDFEVVEGLEVYEKHLRCCQAKGSNDEEKFVHEKMVVNFEVLRAGDEEVVVGEGVVVISSSLDMFINSCLGGIMVSLIFLEGLDEEAFVEFMVEWCEEDEDDDRNECKLLAVASLIFWQWTMDTTIEQQVAMDEALVPHAQRDMLHICPRVHGQSFDEPSFEEEIIAFICFLGHSAAIRMLIDVNINKLYQPWRSFAAIINKCLTEKSSSYDSLRLSQAQILWGLYHKRNIDYAYLLSKDPSIPRRNKVNWHYVRDDHMFSTIKLVSRHQNTQQFSALLPIELTNEEMRNSNAYKEYYAIAIGAAPPKPKACVRRTRSSSDTSITPPTTVANPRLTTSAKGKQTARASKAKNKGTSSVPGVLDAPADESEEELSWNFTNDEGADNKGKVGDDGEEGDGNDDDEDDDGEEGDDDANQEVKRDDEKDVEEEGNGEEDFGLNVGGEEKHVEEEEEDELYKDRMNEVVKVAVQIQSDRLRDEVQRENDEFLKTVDENMQKIIKKQVKEQVKSDRLRDEVQRENDEFLKTVDENMQKIIKKQVKEQVKVQVSKILPRIKKAMNEKLEAEVLTRSSHSSKTSYVVVADLPDMELKKILIEKIEGNKSIQRPDEQRNLYKAFVEAYESDKIILDTYKDTVTIKRRRDDDADKDEEPSAGTDRGSKRRREGKEPESASAPMETSTKSASWYTQGSRS